MSLDLVWIDLETTDLDPADGVILEIAAVITDLNLNRLDSFHRVVYHHDMAEDDMPEVVAQMHAKSGLLDEVRRPEHSTREKDVVEDLIDWLHWTIGEGSKPPLAGSSVHFDRAWLQYHWPEALDFVSHRNVDISTVKELALRWYPPTLEEWENLYSGHKAHRAMDDIRQSIAEARFYRERLFRG